MLREKPAALSASRFLNERLEAFVSFGQLKSALQDILKVWWLYLKHILNWEMENKTMLKTFETVFRGHNRERYLEIVVKFCW